MKSTETATKHQKIVDAANGIQKLYPDFTKVTITISTIPIDGSRIVQKFYADKWKHIEDRLEGLN